MNKTKKPTYEELVDALGGCLSVLKDELPMLGIDKMEEEDRIVGMAEDVYNRAEEPEGKLITIAYDILRRR